MADNYEILEILAELGAAIHTDIAETTEALWTNLFRDVDAKKLRAAVHAYFRTVKFRKIPMPGEILELLRKNETQGHTAILSAIRCRECNERGMVYIRKPHPKRRQITLTVMVPCDCPLGEAKAIYLNKDTRASSRRRTRR